MGYLVSYRSMDSPGTCIHLGLTQYQITHRTRASTHQFIHGTLDGIHADKSKVRFFRGILQADALSGTSLASALHGTLNYEDLTHAAAFMINEDSDVDRDLLSIGMEED